MLYFLFIYFQILFLSECIYLWLFNMSAGQLVPLDRDRGPVLNNTTDGPVVAGSPSIIPTLNNHCQHADIERDYDVVVATICAMYLLFGIVYCLFGKHFFLINLLMFQYVMSTL